MIRYRFDDSIEMFEQYQIKEINQENFPVFNTEAYYFVNKGKFKEAHTIIDEVIEYVDGDKKNKANFLDSKGNFYKMEGKIIKAIEFYKKSLLIINEPPFPFYEETKKKLKECEDKKIGE